MNTYEVHIDKLDLAGIPTTPDFELIYLKREADARIAEMRKAFETSSTDEENKLRARVAELEEENRKLRERNALLQARDDYVTACLI